ncbi:hypothetical protein BXY66_1243 [Shimia isoporae]|uniref:Glutathione synthase/RimK-type ligase-like ATP-grasp enzyme n=1 Tax=Shimia isoporae TaxID=647720 RepID=A0A4R1NVA1_9RHOB|nr:hypothetical protein [Shimia isoporae]TCL09198.1 hypothetical protein BXY66_1243 [Shimia isoporae]
MEPQVRLGVAHLSKLAYSGIDLNTVQMECLTQMLSGNNTSAALMDLSIIAQIHGDPDLGLEFQDKALETHRAFATRRRHDKQPKLLVFAEPKVMGGNTPVEFLLETSDFEVVTFYQLQNSTAADLPKHDLAFCAASTESPTAETFFAKVRELTKDTSAKVLNLPETLVKPERDALQRLFPDVPGLRTAKTALLSRAELLDGVDPIPGQIGAYPNIIRPEGSHAGVGLVKLSSSDDLATYLAQRTEDTFFVSEFMNYADPKDGLFRKQRVVLINGQAFPAHMAVADHWDVWYMNAGMDKSAAKRAEEQAFMDDFDSFRIRHKDALAALNSAFDLEYFGIDCAEDRDGNLVVFEVDNALIVHNMEPEAIYPYKGPHMMKLFKAFEDMLLQSLPG